MVPTQTAWPAVKQNDAQEESKHGRPPVISANLYSGKEAGESIDEGMDHKLPPNQC